MIGPLFSILFWLMTSWNSATAALGPDPTAPLTGGESPVVDATKETNAGPRLQEILHGPQRVIAVIDGKPLKIGEKHRDYKVVDIQRNTVTLQIDGTVRTLHLIDTSAVKR
jgi:hypothetical protein